MGDLAEVDWVSFIISKYRITPLGLNDDVAYFDIILYLTNFLL